MKKISKCTTIDDGVKKHNVALYILEAEKKMKRSSQSMKSDVRKGKGV